MTQPEEGADGSEKGAAAPPPPMPVCHSCRGMTYYTSAMRAAGQRSVCVGLRSTSAEVPPPAGAAESHIPAGEVFSFTCLGCSRVEGGDER